MKIIARADGPIFGFLQARFPEASKTTLRGMLRHGRVTLDGGAVSRADSLVRAGQVIEISERREPELRPPGRILLRDAHLLAAVKPAGLLAVARDPATDDTFYRRLQAYVQAGSEGRERIFIVHRLDRETSGIMLFALSPDIQERLQRAWAATEKLYAAVVEGRPPRREGTLRSWLRENRFHKVYAAGPGPESKLAVTRYRVNKTMGDYTLLDVRIDTGRKNQIRVQLAQAGCPVAGDRKYGARSDPLGRLGLHACALAFTHPETGERVRLRVPPPASFEIPGEGD